MLDHVGVEVSEYERSKAFYEAALAPLGVKLLMEIQSAAAGFGGETEHGPKPYFWISARGRTVVSGAHIAFGARDHETVHAFYAAALAAGATVQRRPRPAPDLPPRLLRRLRARPRRQQRRGRLPPRLRAGSTYSGRGRESRPTQWSSGRYSPP